MNTFNQQHFAAIFLAFNHINVHVCCSIADLTLQKCKEQLLQKSKATKQTCDSLLIIEEGP